MILDHLKKFIAVIPWGLLKMSICTMTQKRFQGPPTRVFFIFLGFFRIITKSETWLSHPHFWQIFKCHTIWKSY